MRGGVGEEICVNDRDAEDDRAIGGWNVTRLLGARVADDGGSVAFRVRAPAAIRLELCLYTTPTGAEPTLRQTMERSDDGTFATTVAATTSLAQGAIYYGYRAFGPNWPYDAAWRPGTEHGFSTDVDANGNRFNPNKLLLDPYACEISHCVQTPEHPDRSDYLTGPTHRRTDTGPFAPKGIVVVADAGDVGAKPTHPLKDDIVYEVHVRGLTMADPDVPEALRGTYAGAALRAPYLRDLGVTAVEFLPVHQCQNALNDNPAYASTHNYWGYQTMGYFAPDRRHAADQSPGGATREFKAMVKAFHAAGLKVFLDVVYNHTEEGGINEAPDARTIYAFRGLDNALYYETLRGQGHADLYEDETGVGPNVNAAEPIVRDLVLDSLAYWSHDLGVDGFRFDLAAVLGNARADGGFQFARDDPDNILNRAVRELPVRPPEGGAGVDLIAEPYAVSMDAQEQGNFPRGWAEWNDRYRDTIRESQNKLGFVPVTPGQMATRIAGSQDLFGNGRRPWASVNYVVCHDGFCLADLHAFDEKQNNQPYPYGPSDGGRSSGDEMGWDHGGDIVAQRQAIRTSLALLLLSAGVPMITSGTEFDRTQHGNNNAYNMDTHANWLDWSLATTNASQLAFTRNLIGFRRAHPALRPADFFTGKPRDGGAIADLTWLRPDGGEIDSGYFGDAGNHFIAWQLDATTAGAARIYVAYNGWVDPIEATLPSPPAGESWALSIDTSASATAFNNAHATGDEPTLGKHVTVAGRSCLVAITRTA